tara:strand:+ start:524 stop:766 length:243 start_codon:yes stop_codon:yes gene_type:complete
MTCYIISLLVCIGILIISRESIGFSAIMYSISFFLFGIISLIESITASTAKKPSSDLNIQSYYCNLNQSLPFNYSLKNKG